MIALVKLGVDILQWGIAHVKWDCTIDYLVYIPKHSA
jgi:hypothetical protein